MSEQLELFEDHPITQSYIYDVLQFQKKFGFPVRAVPTAETAKHLTERALHLQEELNELMAAIKRADFIEQADALVDLVYVALGMALMLGLPWQALWDDVQRANMAKERGITKRGMEHDCVKPAGWVGPRTLGILLEHGYDPLTPLPREVGE